MHFCHFKIFSFIRLFCQVNVFTDKSITVIFLKFLCVYRILLTAPSILRLDFVSCFLFDILRLVLLILLLFAYSVLHFYVNFASGVCFVCLAAYALRSVDCILSFIWCVLGLVFLPMCLLELYFVHVL